MSLVFVLLAAACGSTPQTPSQPFMMDRSAVDGRRCIMSKYLLEDAAEDGRNAYNRVIDDYVRQESVVGPQREKCLVADGLCAPGPLADAQAPGMPGALDSAACSAVKTTNPERWDLCTQVSIDRIKGQPGDLPDEVRLKGAEAIQRAVRARELVRTYSDCCMDAHATFVGWHDVSTFEVQPMCVIR